MTLTEIATIIDDGLNRPFDPLLLERVKRLVVLEYNTFIVEQVDKYGYQGFYKMPYVVNSFEIVNMSRSSTLESANKILRSTSKVPEPANIKNPAPFYYLGSVDGKHPFVYIDFGFQSYLSKLPLVNSIVGYGWVNGYIEIYNNTSIQEVLIEHPFADLRVDYGDSNISSGIHYTDNMEFPAPMNIIKRIIEIIPNRYLNITDDKDKIEGGHLDNN